MAHLEEVPLFLLNAVVFPHSELQLHVFEDRYKEMVRKCRDFDKPLGIVLIRDGSDTSVDAEPFMVGTAAAVSYIHQFADGKIDAMIKGQRRFRIRKLAQEDSILVGLVEPIVEIEVENEERLSALTMRAKECFSEYVRGKFADQELDIQVSFPDDPVSLSFQIASYLPIANRAKQQLLELTDTCTRLSELIPIVEQLLVKDNPLMIYEVHTEQMREWINPN